MINNQLLNNADRFKQLSIAFWLYIFFVAALWVQIVIFSSEVGWGVGIIVLMICGLMVSIFYIYMLSILASEAHKNVFLWILGTVMLSNLGFIISYLRMRRIAKQSGWLEAKTS